MHWDLWARGFTPQALRDRLHGRQLGHPLHPLCLDVGAPDDDPVAERKIVGTPDSSIAGESVDTGGEAKTFADTIRETVPGVLGERAEMLGALALVIQESDRFSGSDLLSEAA